jgi:hypothetical protein
MDQGENMIEDRAPDVMSRRKALSLLGLAGAFGLAAPPIVLTVSDAAAQTIPPAFDQVDKPIPGEEDATQPRRPRRKRVDDRRQRRRKRRSAPRPAPPPASEDKPK